MHLCEFCNNLHDGTYGSGRFCSASCARKFSSYTNRTQTNKKISNSLKYNFKIRYGETRSQKQKRQKEEQNLIRSQYIESLLNSGSYQYIRYQDVNFGNNYLVSTEGIVISCKTLKPMSLAYVDSDRYARVVLKDVYHKRYLLYVHKIVAYTFIPNPNNYPIINHKNENPSDNSVENLEWCTYLYNNTYNGLAERRSQSLKGKIPWNKGKKLK